MSYNLFRNRFHDAGVFHADLNARNILLAGITVYLIDFDRARIGSPSVVNAKRNLQRLHRSLEKLWPDAAEYALNDCWLALEAAYSQ